ncbi:MAG: aminopeptidase N, partial [archaeon]
NHTGSGLHQFIDPEDKSEYLFSDFEPYQAHRMFPCFDQPDLKAVFNLTVEAPRDWEIISNEKGNVKKGKTKIAKFNETKKISTYLFHVSAGNYEYFDDSYKGMRMRIYFRKTMKKLIPREEMFRVTKQGLKFYSNFFNYPYPFSKYDQIFVPEFNSGAMENPGAITFTESYLVRHKPTRTDRAKLANTITHEMAHMWFGDLVTMKWWDDLWLNESFADFMSYLVMVKATDFKDAWEDFYARKSWAYYQDQLITTHPIVANAEDTDIAFANFDGISYAKGASVLKQLMFYIGEKNFRKGVRNYFKKYQWQNTELKDFLKCLEEVYKDDVAKWFDNWIKTTGVNSVTADINFYKNKLNNFRIIQKPSKHNNLLRRHKTQVAVFYEKGKEARPKIIKIITYKNSSTEIPVNHSKNNFGFVFLNYGDWDYAKDILDSYSLEYVKKNIFKVKDSLTRQMLYGCLWNMVRDADFNPSDFLDMILANSQKEENLLLLERLFLRTRVILNYNLGDEKFKDYCNRFFDLSFKVLESNAGMEIKDTWFGLLNFVFSGTSKDRIDKMVKVLEGKIKFKNFEFDQDKKWDLIIGLAIAEDKRMGRFLEREKKIDDSDRGRKKAAVVEATKIANKKKFWELYIKGDGKSLDYIRESMDGFFWRNQKEKLRKYINYFFRDALKVFKKFDKYYAKAFYSNLFPMLYVEKETPERVRRYLKKINGKNKLLEKYVKEGVDDLERALKIREKYG